jgi:hypothetical protein
MFAGAHGRYCYAPIWVGVRPGTSSVAAFEWRRKRVLMKIIGWLVGILIVVWVVSSPSRAGNDVHSWVAGILSFFQHLARG